jgi:hypothetical protein
VGATNSRRVGPKNMTGNEANELLKVSFLRSLIACIACIACIAWGQCIARGGVKVQVTTTFSTAAEAR